MKGQIHINEGYYFFRLDFTAKLGIAATWMFKPNLGVQVGAAYNPLLSSGKVQNNIAADAGFAVRTRNFKHHQQSRAVLD